MKISVICPVFNTAPALLGAAIDSVCGQDIAGICEIIIVDDGSSDPGTLQGISRACARHPRVRAISTGGNHGPAGARNLGIREARGEWVGFLDSDDLWRPDGLQRFTNAIARAPEAEWVAGNYAILRRDGSEEPQPCITDGLRGTLVCEDIVRLEGGALTRFLIGDTRLHLGAILVRRELLVRLGSFAEGLVYGEDWLLFVRLSAVTPLYAILAEVYVLRRQHESLMQSPRRLTDTYVEAQVQARRDPMLRAFQRELRWGLYSSMKGLALNNLLTNRPLAAIGFAFKAWLLDPRELVDLSRFFYLLALSPRRRVQAAACYSRVEQFASSNPL